MKILKSLLVIATLISLTGGVTAAYFTSSVTAQNNQVNTGTFQITLNNSTGPIMGPALRGKNMYPGTFVQSAGLIGNSGTIPLRPSISFANASDAKGMLSHLWLDVWTNGKRWYSGWLNQAPGYSTGKITLDEIAQGGTTAVAFRLTLATTAPSSVQGGVYEVDTVVMGYQKNDPAGAASSFAEGSEFVVTSFSYPKCGVTSTSSYYSYNQAVWLDQVSSNHVGSEGETVGSDAGGYYCQLP